MVWNFESVAVQCFRSAIDDGMFCFVFNISGKKELMVLIGNFQNLRVIVVGF